MPQGKQLELYRYSSIYPIQHFIQLGILLGNLLLCTKGIVPQIVKYWQLLKVSVIVMGILQIVLFVFVPAINRLSSSLVSKALVGNNFIGPGLSLVHTKGRDHAVLDAFSILLATLAALSFISSSWLSSLLAT